MRSIAFGRSHTFPTEIVVVDDGSADGSCAALPELLADAPEVTLVVRTLPTWSGIPFARNRGADIASHPIYFITDGNTTFPLGWDLPIWRHFRSDTVLTAAILDEASDFRACGCQLLLPSLGVTWIAHEGGEPGLVPVAACTATIIDKALFHHLGGYDETLPLYGAAEPEFSVRVWLAGYAVMSLPELEIRHRFRPRTTHDSFFHAYRSVLVPNYLRFALYYLSEPRLARAWSYYAERFPDLVATFEKDGNLDSVWRRRRSLADSLPRDFEWLARTFNVREDC